MTKERVLELCNTQIRNMQDNTPKDSGKDDLLYLMAYNDATLNICDKITKVLEIEEKAPSVPKNPKVCEILTNILADIFEYDDTDAIKVKYMRQIVNKYYEEEMNNEQSN